MQIEKKKKHRKAKTFRAGATDWRGCVLVSDQELWRSAVSDDERWPLKGC